MEHTLSLPVDSEHPVFAGHFPGTPIVPGVLLIDWALAAIEEAERITALPGTLSVVKFLHPVKPGDHLLLHYVIDRDDSGGIAKIKFRIEWETQAVTSGTLSPPSTHR